jgi:hypothetical protein
MFGSLRIFFSHSNTWKTEQKLLHEKEILLAKKNFVSLKNNGLKLLPYVTYFVGFQTMVILDP